MKLDNLLNIIIPLDLGLKGRNEELMRGVKLMLAVLVVSVVAGSAVEAVLGMCPEGAADWCVGVMVAWRIFLHTVIYLLIVVALMAFKGTLKDVLNGLQGSVASSSRGAADGDTADENVFFSSDIDEGALISYIKSGPDKFSSGEDMAIFFLIMKEAGYIGPGRKEFHEFLSSQIRCRGYGPFSSGCQRVKEVLGYHSLDETRRKLVAKYDEMEKILRGFIVD